MGIEAKKQHMGIYCVFCEIRLISRRYQTEKVKSCHWRFCSEDPVEGLEALKSIKTTPDNQKCHICVQDGPLTVMAIASAHFFVFGIYSPEFRRLCQI